MTNADAGAWLCCAGLLLCWHSRLFVSSLLNLQLLQPYCCWAQCMQGKGSTLSQNNSGCQLFHSVLSTGTSRLLDAADADAHQSLRQPS
jgi:hypothetical protein